MCANAVSPVVESLEARQLLAGVTFNIQFVNSDAYASYFNQVRATLLDAANEWARYFDGANATIDLQVSFRKLASGVLAQAAPDVVQIRREGPRTIVEPSPISEIRTGVDPNVGIPDGFVEINTDYLTQMHFDSNTSVPPAKFDGFSILAHELGHVFGFSGYANDYTGTTTSIAMEYDLYIQRIGGDFYFTGPSATAAYGGPVPLAFGSVHHYGNPGGPGADLDGYLMSTSIGPGERVFVSDLDIAILRDLGMPILGVVPSQTQVIVRTVDAIAGEDGPNHGRFRFERSGSTAAPLDVFYTVSGSATNGSDYVTLSGKVTIPAGASFVDLDLTVIDDAAAEGVEDVTIMLSTGPGYTIGAGAAATISIQDNDGGVADNRPGVYVRALDGEAGETTGGMGIFRFYRTGNTSLPLTIYYTVDGTALPGVDYNGLPGSVTIKAGESFADVAVRVIDDSIVESTETVVVNLSAHGSYRLAGQSSATVSVFDNDGLFTPGTMIMGTVYNDLNANGRKDAEDKAIYGWVVWIDDNKNGVLDPHERRATVNANGRFVFDRLAAGTYTLVSVPVNSEWRVTSKGGRVQQVTVRDRQITQIEGFGFSKSARVAGSVFTDADRNGLQEGKEAGLPNWFVYVDENRNGVFDKGERVARTNARGYYIIDGLEEGNHSIRVHTKLGWEMTVLSPSTLLPLSLHKAQVFGGYNFAVTTQA